MVVKKKRGGHKAKDASIRDGFNEEKTEVKIRVKDMSPEQKRAYNKQKQEERRKRDKEIEQGGVENVSFSAQMLNDMRNAYRKGGGRSKLVKIIKSDDKEFKFMVKELMKVETSLLTAKIRTKESSVSEDKQNVFVIFKGLERDAKDTDPIIELATGDVDMKQIAKALSPEGGDGLDF